METLEKRPLSGLSPTHTHTKKNKTKIKKKKKTNFIVNVKNFLNSTSTNSFKMVTELIYASLYLRRRFNGDSITTRNTPSFCFKTGSFHKQHKKRSVLLRGFFSVYGLFGRTHWHTHTDHVLCLKRSPVYLYLSVFFLFLFSGIYSCTVFNENKKKKKNEKRFKYSLIGILSSYHKVCLRLLFFGFRPEKCLQR